MAKGSRKKLSSLERSLGEALERFCQIKSGEVAEVICRDLTEGMKDTEKRIREAREEIDRGARTRGRRFRI
jgi:hypothetical protein